MESGDPNLDSALNCIPMHGNVSKHQFDEYSRNLSKAFPNGNFGVASGTRLLCMKRPDFFLSVNGANIDALKAYFPGIRLKKVSGQWQEPYWHLIQALHSAPWFNQPRPPGPFEAAIWNYRVAFVDVFVYNEWEKSHPTEMALINHLLRVVKEACPDAKLDNLADYISVKCTGVKKRSISFRPFQGYIHMAFRIPRCSELDERLQAWTDGGLAPFDDKHNQYRIFLRNPLGGDAEALVRDLTKQAINHNQR